MYNRVVVKIGTNVITGQEGYLDQGVMQGICSQLSEIKNKGIEIIIVSSGSVGAGLSKINISDKLNKVTRRQVLSSVGQVTLMQTWSQLFNAHQLHVAQVLATKEDFRDRAHYINMRNCFQALMRDDIIPIVNENDVISVSALMFTDNDELGCQVAAMMDADAFIILSNVDGLMDKSPDDPEARLIAEIDPHYKKIAKYILPSQSNFGRGGMHTKIRMASKAIDLGMDCFIANGKKDDVLRDIFKGLNPGTKFTAKKKISNLKKWIASENSIQGKVVINQGAEEVLRSKDRVTSLLPIGIIKIAEEFKKGDVIKIVNGDGESIGLGLAKYSSSRAKENMGLRGKRPLVHYDYLFIPPE